jgi:hypothetical protein
MWRECGQAGCITQAAAGVCVNSKIQSLFKPLFWIFSKIFPILSAKFETISSDLINLSMEF